MTFTNPWAFLLLPVIVPLILLYLFKENERRISVPSLLFWKSLEQRPAVTKSMRMQRFISDPLFWLQLLVLLLIIGTMAEPVFQKSVRKVVLIMDISASMQTREFGGDRMTLAKNEALGLLDQLEEADRIALIAAGSQPERILDFTINKDLARSRIEMLEAQDTSARLHEALSLASTMAEADGMLDVVVISDQAEENRGDPAVQTAITTRFIVVGQTDVNSGFVAFHPRSALFGQEVAGDLILRNYQSAPSAGRIRMIQGGRTILDEQVELPPGSSVPIVMEALDSAIPVEVVFETQDSLSADNRAYFLPVTHQKNTLQVVTDNPDLVLLLRQLEDFQISVIPLSDRNRSQTPSDVYVYDGMMPTTYPAGGVIVLAPHDPGHPLTDQNIYNWSPDHPVLRDIVLERISLAGAALIDNTPPWATVIARTQNHPIILAGDMENSRRVILAPDLIRQKESPTALLLLLKALEWVNPETISGRKQIKTGEPFLQSAISDTGAVTILSPSGSPLPVLYQNGTLHMTDTVKSGIYTVRSASGDQYFAANLFNEIESDIRPPRHVPNAASLPLQAQAVVDTAYWRWALWAVMIMMLSGWLYESRRQRL